MCDRINVINQCYKILVYDKINKQEALNKISTLHENLKFKNYNNFSDRYFQTASIIEKNLSIFKSVCNHVDIVTSLLDHLYANGIKLMFDSTVNVNVNDFNIIYLMFIICEDQEIPLFLKKAIIDNSDNSNLTNMDKYVPLISNCTTEMIVFEDSDLHAIITYLKIKPCMLQMKKIFIQESVKQKFLWLLEKNCKHLLYADLPIFIFHSKNELFTYCKDFLRNFNLMSIWSEDSISAKTLAMKLQNDVIFINAYLEFSTGIKLPLQKKIINNILFDRKFDELEGDPEGDKINLNAYKVYNHFYNGTWQKPAIDAYWINNDNVYAYATRKDMYKIFDSAMEAFESWGNLPINSRIKILNNLAYTLEYNGKYLLAKTVSKHTKLLNKLYKNMLRCQDERLEVITIRAPRGVIAVYQTVEVILFTYMTIALYFGNCIIAVYNENSCNIPSYLNMFSTAEIPPGVINLISDKDIEFRSVGGLNLSLNEQLLEITQPKNIILPLK